jgi:hypothetical protein
MMVVVATHVRCLIYTADGSSLNKNSIVPTMATILFGICDMAEISPFKWPPHITIHQGPKPFFWGENYLNSKVSKPGILQDLHHRTRSFARLVPRGFQFVVPSASVGLHQLSDFPMSVAATTGFRAKTWSFHSFALKFHDFQL